MELLFLFCISCILALIDESIEQVANPPNGDPLEKKYGRIRYAALVSSSYYIIYGYGVVRDDQFE